MSARGGSSSDMPAIPYFGNRQGLSAAAADGMLDGHGVSAQAPAEQQILARLLNSAAAPPAEHELSGQTAAVAMFVLANRDDDTRHLAVRPPARRLKLLVFGGVAAACISAFGGAAAAGALPSHLQQMAHIAFGAPAPAPSQGRTGHSVRPRPSPTTVGASPSATNQGGTGHQVGHRHVVQHGKAKGHSKSPSPSQGQGQGQGRNHKKPTPHPPNTHSEHH